MVKADVSPIKIHRTTYEPNFAGIVIDLTFYEDVAIEDAAYALQSSDSSLRPEWVFDSNPGDYDSATRQITLRTYCAARLSDQQLRQDIQTTLKLTATTERIELSGKQAVFRKLLQFFQLFERLGSNQTLTLQVTVGTGFTNSRPVSLTMITKRIPRRPRQRS